MARLFSLAPSSPAVTQPPLFWRHYIQSGITEARYY